MRLRVMLPAAALVDQEVDKVTAEAENGFFTLLEHHIDFVAALVPGLLYFREPAGGEEFLALDEGILVKRGSEVLISARNGVRGHDLGALKRQVAEQFERLDERERQARSVLAKLEADFVRQFIKL